MIRRTIAAHSLRHLRFARRVTGAQPLLPRAQDGSVAPTHAGNSAYSAYAAQATYVSPEGRVLPIAPVLRHIPQRELAPKNEIAPPVAPQDEEMDLADMAAQPEPSEALLRLLPRLRAVEVPAEELSEADTYNHAPKPAPMRRATLLPGENRPTAPTQPSEPRPRSRIVELPGIVSAPIAEDADEEPGNPSQPQSANPAEEAADAPSSQAFVSGPAALPPVSSDPVAPAVAETRTPRRRRGSKEPAPPPPPRAADALFQPTEDDRSPQSWFAKLQQAEQPAPVQPVSPPRDEQPSSPRRRGGQQSPQPTAPRSLPAPESAPAATVRATALPDSTRVLLQSLTGVDPANVPIYRGSAAERITADQNADALTDGEAILLGTGHTSDTLETLGLLAHELTHVARRRSPRFVPPVARPSRVNAPQAPGLPPSSAANDSIADEESQARRVEAAVRNIASTRVQPAPAANTTATGSTAPAMPDRGDSQPYGESAQDAPSRWGTLPAPWEPLPNWMTAAPVVQPRPAAPQTSPSSATSSADTASSPEAPGTDSGIQRAEHGRSLPEVESASSRASQTRAIEPDLDVLAQQVHAILKRRLAAERRRFG